MEASRPADGVLKCELCGSHVLRESAELYVYEGAEHVFCSAAHRDRWLDLETEVALEEHRTED